ncbi:MAG: sugar transferase [Nocardioides sp.]|uniref:sugar transferase n=1 Tax=Nocardioides sp. TaxID=35761 RepID=UPI003F05C85D
MPRPRAAAEVDVDVECAEIGAPVHTLSVAPEIATRRRPRRGAESIRSWLGPVAALFSVLVLAQLGALVPAVVMSALVVLWPAALVNSGFHRRRPVAETSTTEVRRILTAAGRLGLLCWVAPMVASAAGLPAVLGSPVALALHVGALAACTVVLALLTRQLVPVALPAMVLVGHPDDVAAALPELGRGGYRPVAVCLTEPASPASAAAMAHLTVHVGLHQVSSTLRSAGADGLLVLPGPDVEPMTVRRLQWQAAAENAEAYVATGVVDVHPTRVQAVAAGGLRVVHIDHPQFQGATRVVKEVLERTLAFLLVMVLSPLLAVVAVAVRRDSPGPALFRQERVGRQGELFTMLKFRSMRVDAEEDRAGLGDRDEGAGVLFKIRQDPRVTPLGAWMRKFSVDELPQLWNVVRGEMALVGPRPALPDEVENYSFDPRRRLAVKPGLTGLWQVSGRSDLSWEESVRLDVRYVDNWSLRLDASILVRTVRAVLEHRGAY